MDSYTNILLATDFSKMSDHAAARAVDLAQRCSAKLTLCHVVEHFPTDIPVDVIPPEGGDKEQYVLEQAQNRLQEYAVKIGHENADLVALISEGSAKRVIAELAQQRHTDLIVVGAHGHHGIARLLGSTASGLMNIGECDVLAVRMAEG